MFSDEANMWYNIPKFNVLAQNISVPGLSSLFPEVHYTKDGSICQLTTGEGEMNAASTVATLLHSSAFDLRTTYFLIAGIAGVSSKVATIDSVTFAAMPCRWGFKVLEMNENLRQLAFRLAKTAEPGLNDTTDCGAARAPYPIVPQFAATGGSPSVVLCDTATSDTFGSGTLLAEAFENTTKLFTNQSATYCATPQEDIMRSASDLDRPLPGESAVASLLGPTPGFVPSISNLHIAGVKIVQAIVSGWKDFEGGVKATNYVGDIFGSLGGKPDFGPGSMFGGKAAKV
ncbi:Purine nucleoside [Mycena venus]|uniref:Purine nucleoside n=1 Tax=Mycena venus TaxID=2733690 RepID=A0A8H6YEF2_9AGAR|nr:Purine nucleoside [Mycena venus]